VQTVRTQKASAENAVPNQPARETTASIASRPSRKRPQRWTLRPFESSFLVTA